MPTVSVTISNEYKETGHDNNSEALIEEGSVLISELSNAGFPLASGCLAGSCGVCAAFIIKDPENLKPASAVEQDTILHLESRYEEVFGVKPPHPIRLICRAKVVGNVTIAPFSIKA